MTPIFSPADIEAAKKAYNDTPRTQEGGSPIEAALNAALASLEGRGKELDKHEQGYFISRKWLTELKEIAESVPDRNDAEQSAEALDRIWNRIGELIGSATPLPVNRKGE